jgi:hypothetical protein
VYECIRLAIITADKAKALGGIEELDGAGGPLAGRLTLCEGRFALLCNDHFANNRQIARRNLATPFDQLELKLLALGQRAEAGCLDGADMHEGIVAAILKLDEAEALVRVEELHGAAPLADDLRGRAASTRTTAATAGAAKTTALIAGKAIVTAEAVIATETVVTTAEPVTVAATVSSVK